MRSKDLRATFRVILTTFELHLKQQAVDLFVIFTVLIQPILIALLAIYLLRDEAASNAIYIVVGSGMTGLWSGLLFTSAFNIRGERWMGTLEMLVGSPTLVPGTSTVSLYFDGDAIRDHGQDGPWTVADVYLADSSGAAIQLDEAHDVHTTPAYDHTMFGEVIPSLLTNASFEKGPRIPAPWKSKNLTLKDRRVCKMAHDGRCSFRMVGTKANKSLRQVVRISGSAGDTFTLRGWSKARNPLRKGGPYCLQAKVFHTDGTKKTYRTCFAKRYHGWQRRKRTFTTVKDYNKIMVYLLYFKQGGTAWFDDVRLVAH